MFVIIMSMRRADDIVMLVLLYFNTIPGEYAVLVGRVVIRGQHLCGSWVLSFPHDRLFQYLAVANARIWHENLPSIVESQTHLGHTPWSARDTLQVGSFY